MSLSRAARLSSFVCETKGRITTAHLSDANADLISTYQAVRDRPEEVIEEFRSLAAQHCRDFYLSLRSQIWETGWTPGRFLYMRLAGFNGLYRLNKRGQFNVPFGNKKTIKVDEDRIRRVSSQLQGVDLQARCFRSALIDVKSGDFCYIDPPYVPRSESAKFTAYTSGGFGLADQEDLATAIEGLIDMGAHVIASNSWTPWVVDRYERSGRLDVAEVSTMHTIGRISVSEALILGREIAHGASQPIVNTPALGLAR